MVKICGLRGAEMVDSPNVEVEADSESVKSEPNRFKSTGRQYDRSLLGMDCKYPNSCVCFRCSEEPFMVISKGPIKEKIKASLTIKHAQEFVDGGVMKLLPLNSMMIYSQPKGDGTRQVGLMASIDVEDCRSNVLKRHEHTTMSPDAIYKEKKAVPFADPIMVMYRATETVTKIMSDIMAAGDPIVLPSPNGCEADNEQHLLWFVSNEKDVAALQRAFESIPDLYIADGHHRTAMACRLSESPMVIRRKGTKTSPVTHSRYLSALIFPDSDLQVLSYHRCIDKFEDGVTAEMFLGKVSEVFEVAPCEAVDSVTDSDRMSDQSSSLLGLSRPSTNSLGMYLNHCWYELKSRRISSEDAEDPLGQIDSQVLMVQLFQPILNVDSPNSASKVVYVDGREGFAGLEARVDSGDAAVAFSVRRVSTQQIMQVADSNQLFPPKATFFHPKPMSGVMLRLQR